MTLTVEDTATLNNGITMPCLGLGVYLTPDGNRGDEIIRSAIEAGYRHIDTAAMYDNEDAVGLAVRSCGLGRSDLFVTTKLWVDDHGYDRTLKAFDESMEKLGLEYVDLYLSHWPVQEKRLDSWKAMEKLHLEGRCRAIGVSNYMVRHLTELEAECRVVPAVNQIEIHPYNYRDRLEVIDFCRDRGIVVQAYSPLTKGQKLNDPVLKKIGEPHGKSPAQVLIRWSLQHGFVTLPKSGNPERIRENCAVYDFELSEEEMATLDGLNENLLVSWDPTTVP